MRKREFEILGKELFDVGAFDVVCFLDFDNLEDLCNQSVSGRDSPEWENSKSLRELT